MRFHIPLLRTRTFSITWWSDLRYYYYCTFPPVDPVMTFAAFFSFTDLDPVKDHILYLVVMLPLSSLIQNICAFFVFCFLWHLHLEEVRLVLQIWICVIIFSLSDFSLIKYYFLARIQLRWWCVSFQCITSGDTWYHFVSLLVTLEWATWSRWWQPGFFIIAFPFCN